MSLSLSLFVRCGVADQRTDIWDSQRKSFTGTVYFMAPEVIQQKGQDVYADCHCHCLPLSLSLVMSLITLRTHSKADIWAVGCTVIEMACGRPPYAQISDIMAAMFQIVTADSVPIPESLSPAGHDFVRLCMMRYLPRLSVSLSLSLSVLSTHSVFLVFALSR
jgi:serine/threonine protein kinase